MSNVKCQFRERIVVKKTSNALCCALSVAAAVRFCGVAASERIE